MLQLMQIVLEASMEVQKTTLSNGLTIVTDTLPTVETVSLGVWVRVGSRYESADFNGISHMLEHMAFKGTEQRDARQIAEEIESVGGHLNAFTSSETTAYHASVMKENVFLALNMIADILQNSTFLDEELTRERAVIIQEIAHSQDSPEDLVFESFQQLSYPEHPLGRSILGQSNNIKRIQREDLFDFMKKHYGATRMIVAAAGNLDHEVFCRWCEDVFPVVSRVTGEKPQAAKYRGGFSHLERNFEQLHMVVGYPGPSALDSKRFAAGVGSIILGGGMSSRLFQEIREKLGLAYAIYSFNSTYEDTGQFGVYAGTTSGQAKLLLETLHVELNKYLSSLKEEELIRAKAQLRSGILMSLERTSSRVERIARDTALFGAPTPIERVIASIDDVSLNDIKSCFQTIFSCAPTIATVGTKPDNLVDEEVTNMFSRVSL